MEIRQSVREAIEIVKEIRDNFYEKGNLSEDLEQSIRERFYKRKEALQTLISLAQSVLDAKMPKEREHEEWCQLINKKDCFCGAKEYNQAIKDFRLYQEKCLGELDEEKILDIIQAIKFQDSRPVTGIAIDVVNGKDIKSEMLFEWSATIITKALINEIIKPKTITEEEIKNIIANYYGQLKHKTEFNFTDLAHAIARGKK